MKYNAYLEQTFRKSSNSVGFEFCEHLGNLSCTGLSLPCLNKKKKTKTPI